MCHGSNLEGTPIAPTLQAHDWKDAKGGTYAAIVGVVTTGVTGTAMVSHQAGSAMTTCAGSQPMSGL